MKNLCLEISIIKYLVENHYSLIFAKNRIDNNEWHLLFRDSFGTWKCCSFYGKQKKEGLYFAHIGIVDFCFTASTCSPRILYGISISSYNQLQESLHSEEWQAVPSYDMFESATKLKFQYSTMSDMLDEKSLKIFLECQSIDY